MLDNAITALNMYQVLDYYLSGPEIPFKAWLDAENYINLSGHFSPARWQDIQILDRYNQNIFLVFTQDQAHSALMAIGYYHARYAIEHLSKETISKIVKKYVFTTPQDDEDLTIWQQATEDTAIRLYADLSKALKEPDFKNMFMKLEPKTVTVAMLKDFKEVVKYPARLKFTKAAQEKIEEQILANKLPARTADYYLGSFATYTDSAKQLSIVEHIIKNTTDQHLLWTAGDILNMIWKSLPEDEYLQSSFRRKVYNLYWPRINSTWPIVNYQKIEFKSEIDQQIFDDALGWIFSLKDIDKHNPSIGHYLEFLSAFPPEDQSEEGIPNPIINSAFLIKHRNDSSQNIAKTAIKEFPALEAFAILSSPETTEDAKAVIDLIFSTPIDPDDLPAIIEKILLNGKDKETGPYLLNAFAAHAENLTNNFTKINVDEPKNHKILLGLLEAAADGATEPTEIPALESFADTITSLPSADSEKPAIKASLEKILTVAKNNVKDYQSAQKILIEKLAY
ncbi:hypothetical protein IJ096_03590 [Candidatus Saccharibacteria bacterium]|nr:hypothetical protein [Candidatus Saccharibacteria bacterium]